MEKTLLKKSNLENVYSDTYLADQTLDDVECTNLSVSNTLEAANFSINTFQISNLSITATDTNVSDANVRVMANKMTTTNQPYMLGERHAIHFKPSNGNKITEIDGYTFDTILDSSSGTGTADGIYNMYKRTYVYNQGNQMVEVCTDYTEMPEIAGNTQRSYGIYIAPETYPSTGNITDSTSLFVKSPVTGTNRYTAILGNDLTAVVGIGTSKPTAKLNIHGSSSDTVLLAANSFNSSSTSTDYTLPPVDMITGVQSIDDKLYSLFFSDGGSSSLHTIFNKNSTTSWVGTDQSYILSGNIGTYNGSHVTTTSNGTTYAGEYIQINSQMGFKVNSYRWKTENNTNRCEPRKITLLGSFETTGSATWQLIETRTYSTALGQNVFSPYFTLTNPNFFKSYRFIFQEIEFYGSVTFKTAITQIEYRGVPESITLCKIENSKVILQPLSGNVGIGTSIPRSNALLDLTSSTKGFLTPRMSIQDRDAIPVTSFDKGLTIYNTSTNYMNVFNGTGWDQLSPASQVAASTTSPMSTPVPMTITSVGTTQPSKGTIAVDYIMSRKVADKYYEIIGRLRNTTGGVRGTGSYLFTMPDGLTISTTNQSFYTGESITPQMYSAVLNGFCALETAKSDLHFRSPGVIVAYDATRFRIYAALNGSVVHNFVGENAYFFGNDAPYILSYIFNFFVFIP